LKRIPLFSIEFVEKRNNGAENQLKQLKPWISMRSIYYTLSTESIEQGSNTLSDTKLTPAETQLLQETLNTDYKQSNIRLRQGEHQYAIAKAIASFQLELYFPDVKDIVKNLYEEEKTNDVQLIRKVQTILKKMEKSDIVKILPKKKPWELQRYALSSFKFQDAEKNFVILATDAQIRQAKNRLDSTPSQQETSIAKLRNVKTAAYTLISAFIIVTAYLVSIWGIMQPTINPTIFVLGFSIAAAGSIMLGRILSRG
jgi:hypothetical protein